MAEAMTAQMNTLSLPTQSVRTSSNSAKKKKKMHVWQIPKENSKLNTIVSLSCHPTTPSGKKILRNNLSVKDFLPVWHLELKQSGNVVPPKVHCQKTSARGKSCIREVIHTPKVTPPSLGTSNNTPNPHGSFFGKVHAVVGDTDKQKKQYILDLQQAQLNFILPGLPSYFFQPDEAKQISGNLPIWRIDYMNPPCEDQNTPKKRCFSRTVFLSHQCDAALTGISYLSCSISVSLAASTR